MLLYLHGFLSSPASAKARLLQQALAAAGRGADFLCPPLPVSPRAAAEVAWAAAQLEEPERLAIVGSSLGGYYATWLGERIGCRVVLLNPAVRPYELLSGRVGWMHDPATGRDVHIAPEYLDELRALEVGRLRHPERSFLVAATGDEVIDHRAMLERYAGCPTLLIEGSDHALSDFEAHMPEVLRFCGITPATGGRVAAPS